MDIVSFVSCMYDVACELAVLSSSLLASRSSGVNFVVFNSSSSSWIFGNLVSASSKTYVASFKRRLTKRKKKSVLVLDYC